MKRGEIWTVSGAPGYGSKPRPALIVQSDLLGGAQSVLTCGFTTQPNLDLPFRPWIERSSDNGLDHSSSVMADKLAAVSRTKLGERIGELSEGDMTRVEHAMLLALGFEG